MKEINLEEVGLEQGKILTDFIRQWRSDCQAGQFKIGASNFKGNKIEMELIGAQINEGEFFGYEYQKWIALLFVDPDGIVSSILFKTESLENFMELHHRYKVKGESLLGKTVLAQMAKRSSRSNGNSYYAVEFSVISDGKYAEQIAQFRQQHYSSHFARMIEAKPEPQTA